MNAERLPLLINAGWFRDELATAEDYAVDDDAPGFRAIDRIDSRVFPGPGARISDACFVARYQPVTTRDFDAPCIVRFNAWLGRRIEAAEQAVARILAKVRR